jgi:hypothetical protein
VRRCSQGVTIILGAVELSPTQQTECETLEALLDCNMAACLIKQKDFLKATELCRMVCASLCHCCCAGFLLPLALSPLLRFAKREAAN